MTSHPAPANASTDLHVVCMVAAQRFHSRAAMGEAMVLAAFAYVEAWAALNDSVPDPVVINRFMHATLQDLPHLDSRELRRWHAEHERRLHQMANRAATRRLNLIANRSSHKK